MKKIGLSILAAIVALSVNAQQNAPRELNCTEEAVTFKTSFSSGWHFSKPVFSQQRVSTIAPDFTMPGLFLLQAVTPKIPEHQVLERPSFSFRQPINPAMPYNLLFTQYFDFKAKKIGDYQFLISPYFRSTVRPVNNVE